MEAGVLYLSCCQALTLSAMLTQSFNKMIDRRMAASPVDGLIVYPEGMPPCHVTFLLTLKKPSNASCMCFIHVSHTVAHTSASCTTGSSCCCRASEHLKNVLAIETWHAGVRFQPEDPRTGESFMPFSLHAAGIQHDIVTRATCSPKESPAAGRTEYVCSLSGLWLAIWIWMSLDREKVLRRSSVAALTNLAQSTFWCHICDLLCRS